MGPRVINLSAKKIKEQYCSSLEVTAGCVVLYREVNYAVHHSANVLKLYYGSLPSSYLCACCLALGPSVYFGCFPASVYVYFILSGCVVRLDLSHFLCTSLLSVYLSILLHVVSFQIILFLFLLQAF